MPQKPLQQFPDYRVCCTRLSEGCCRPSLRIPVLMGDPGRELLIICETVVSKENVSRLAENKGYKITEEKDGQDYRLYLKPQDKI
jgi:hypothetical protein